MPLTSAYRSVVAKYERPDVYVFDEDSYRLVKLTWGRWGKWSAHLFDGDRQMCSTQHGSYARGGRCGPTPPPFDASPALSTHGVPYGHVCSHCLKLFNGLRKS